MHPCVPVMFCAPSCIWFVWLSLMSSQGCWSSVGSMLSVVLWLDGVLSALHDVFCSICLMLQCGLWLRGSMLTGAFDSLGGWSDSVLSCFVFVTLVSMVVWCWSAGNVGEGVSSLCLSMVFTASLWSLNSCSTHWQQAQPCIMMVPVLQ